MISRYGIKLHFARRLVSRVRRYLMRRRSGVSHPGSERLAHPVDVHTLGTPSFSIALGLTVSDLASKGRPNEFARMVSALASLRDTSSSAFKA